MNAQIEARSIRSEIAKLMADGRERTTNDVALKLRITPHRAAKELAAIMAMGLLTRQYMTDGGMACWRKSGAAE